MYLFEIFIATVTCIALVEGQNNTIETTTNDCDTSDMQVDSFKLNAFVHNYAESAKLSEDEYQNVIFLPKKVYDTAMYLLGAQKFDDIAFGVLCTANYPDLIFTILGRELHIPQKYYVSQLDRDNNLCKILLDYKTDDPSYEFPRHFQKNICRLLY